jgi:hypothetical protein
MSVEYQKIVLANLIMNHLLLNKLFCIIFQPLSPCIYNQLFAHKRAYMYSSASSGGKFCEDTSHLYCRVCMYASYYKFVHATLTHS